MNYCKYKSYVKTYKRLFKSSNFFPINKLTSILTIYNELKRHEHYFSKAQTSWKEKYVLK